MTQYRIHITKQNERWDNIAWYYYRDVSKISMLIEENQHVPIIPCLPPGLKLRIPLIEQPQAPVNLPPWK